MVTSVEIGSPSFGLTPQVFRITHLSVELTNLCSKGCWFCYNDSGSGGATVWTNESLLGFIEDCFANGLEALSLGGGEPLEYPGLFQLLRDLPEGLGRSLTTNGILLDTSPKLHSALLAAPIDKVHVSVHFPERLEEVDRALRLVDQLEEAGTASGVNLLVRSDNLEAARRAYERMGAHGVGAERLVLLPMKGAATPSADDMAIVAGSSKFQSMSCLLGCAASPRFASVGWDGRVAWCSYTESRAHLVDATFESLQETLTSLDLRTC